MRKGFVLASVMGALLVPSLASAQVQGQVVVQGQVGVQPVYVQQGAPIVVQQPVMVQQQQPQYYQQQPVYQQPMYAPPPMQAPRMVMQYRGQPVPPGYHIEARPNRALIGGGAGLFGGFYLLSVLIGAGTIGSPGAGFNFVPVVGPVIWAASNQCGYYSSGLCGLGYVWGALDTIAQAAGVAMFIAGFAAPARLLVPDGMVASRNPGRWVDRSMRWAVLPSASGTSLGLNFTGVNF